MLSITGMTNEQFASLMAGLGYDVKKGEREKEKKLISEAEVKEMDQVSGMEDSINNQEIAEAITEIFWSFTWQNKKIKNKTSIDVNISENPNKPKKIKNNYSNKKDKNKKQIEKETPPDPNNPFAVLLALKES